MPPDPDPLGSTPTPLAFGLCLGGLARRIRVAGRRGDGGRWPTVGPLPTDVAAGRCDGARVGGSLFRPRRSRYREHGGADEDRFRLAVSHCRRAHAGLRDARHARRGEPRPWTLKGAREAVGGLVSRRSVPTLESVSLFGLFSTSDRGLFLSSYQSRRECWRGDGSVPYERRLSWLLLMETSLLHGAFSIALMARVAAFAVFLVGTIFTGVVNAENIEGQTASAYTESGSADETSERTHVSKDKVPDPDNTKSATDNPNWERYAELAAFVVFGITISLLILGLFKKIMKDNPQVAIRGAALILIVSSTIIIVLAEKMDKAGPVIGLYGAVVGYLLARPDSNGKGRVSSDEHPLEDGDHGSERPN